MAKRSVWLGADERGYNYVQAHISFVRDSRVTPIAKAVFLGIASHASNGGGDAYMAHATLAKYAGCSRRSVQTAIDLLVSLDYVRCDPRPGVTGVYVLLPQPSVPVDDALTDGGQPTLAVETTCAPPAQPPAHVERNTCASPAHELEPQNDNQRTNTADAVRASVNVRAQELARLYCDEQPLSNFPAVMGIAKKAIGTGLYEDRDIAGALLRLARDGRPVTTDTLRIELQGLPPRDSLSRLARGTAIMKETGVNPFTGKSFDERERRALG